MSRASKIALFSAFVIAVTATGEASAAHHRRGGNQARVAAIIQQMDADHNGRVSKEEFMQYMSSEFDRLDRDRSGELTSEEISRSSLLTGGGAHSSPHR
jgi:Ca2+-binding EF-hand superfamily protein